VPIGVQAMNKVRMFFSLEALYTVGVGVCGALCAGPEELLMLAVWVLITQRLLDKKESNGFHEGWEAGAAYVRRHELPTTPTASPPASRTWSPAKKTAVPAEVPEQENTETYW
jgi:hypothetical protein